VSGSGAVQPEIHAAAICDIFGPGCFQLYPDVQPVLQELHRNGLKLAVISNWHRGLKFFCQELNLSGILGPVIASADIGIEKPDSRIFHEAARQLGIDSDRIVHIGDLPRDDFEGAIGAGLRPILIDRSNKHSTHPDRITSLFELRRQLAVLA
jgi:FMN phosphatase YigB (HAD superfamily)